MPTLRLFGVHQLKQVIPSASLIAGISLGNLLVQRFSEKERTRYTSALLVGLILLYFPYDSLSVNLSRTIKRYPDRNVAFGAWLREHTRRDDYIYIAGKYGNPILSYCGRVSSSKYFNTIFVTGHTEKEKLLNDLKARPPLYFLGSADMGAELEKYAVENYDFLHTRKEYEEYRVFKRKPKGPWATDL